MNLVSPLHVLMCHPRHFGVFYEINEQMKETMGRNMPVIKDRAILQWNNLVAALLEEGVAISYIPPEKNLPDMVFTANAGFVSGNSEIILSNFRHRERSPENSVFFRYFVETLRYNVLLPSHKALARRGISQGELFHRPLYFEGNGDALFYQDVLCAGYGDSRYFRSNSDGIDAALRSAGFSGEHLKLELCDKRFYHLDTCFCPIGDVLLFYPRAFSKKSQHDIVELVRSKKGTLLPVSPEDAQNFVCNGIPIETKNGFKLITSHTSKTACRKLEEYNIELISVSTTEFLKSGAGARCLVLFLSP